MTEVLEDFYEDMSSKDFVIEREIGLDNGNKLRVKKDPQYGFWTFHMHGGQIPEWMKGSYTSLDEVQKAVNRYVNEKDQTDKKPDVRAKSTDSKRVKPDLFDN